jgi:hypothetical protein
MSSMPAMMRSLSSSFDDPDMTQDRAGKLGEEALDKIEPGAMLGREGELEAAAGRVASQALVSREICAE